jgi:hypothetical protein
LLAWRPQTADNQPAHTSGVTDSGQLFDRRIRAAHRVCAALVWLFVSWGWLDVGNATTMTWVVLVALGLILGVGMSWSIVRRELTGQASVDEVGDNR